MTIAPLIAKWRRLQAEHPTIAHVFVVAESAALGAAVDLYLNGMRFDREGLINAAAIIGAAVGLAVRNYLKNNVRTLQTQLGL